MRLINLFKPIKKGKRIEYNDTIMRAVNDQSIKGLRINVNGGYDWIDQKHCFLRLLLLRGQVAELRTGQDLVSCEGYLYSIEVGMSRLGSPRLVVSLENRTIEVEGRVLPVSPKGCAYASNKRMDKARARFKEYFQKTHNVRLLQSDCV